MTTHFIAIGGAGMSVVAELMLAAGEAVQGSDRADSPRLTELRDLGATVWMGHDPAHLDGARRVVVSTAIRPDNPELVRARELNLPVLHRSEALALVAGDRPFVAVAGAHGKTTTSGMLAAALRAVGADPSFAVGAPVAGVGSGAHAGSGAFVAEADESDGSFLHYTPQIAVVTNIEPDHLDHYGSAEKFFAAFDAFAARVVPGGLLVACADDPGSARLAAHVGERQRVRTYGVSSAAQVRLENIALGPRGASADLHTEAGVTHLELQVPGHHNLLNAAAAWVTGLELGIGAAEMAAGLAEFRGTGRRFEERGSAGGVRVVDDYAHHPTEVAALLRTARTAAQSGRVLVLFQPHLFSRTQNFAREFAAALALADVCVLTDIYPAREEPIPGVTSALIADLLPDAVYVPDAHVAAHHIAGLARPGDLVLTVGAGDVTALGPMILAALS